MLDSAFRVLFKYSPVVFQQGEFRFAPAAGSYAALTVAVVALAATFITWRSAVGGGRTRDRLVLGALRIAALGLAVFCLFRPVLIVKAAVPQQNFIGVLLDDSRSMQIGDFRGGARAAFVREQFGDGEGLRNLLAALSDRFVTRAFRFASATSRARSVGDLTFEGTQSRLGGALEGARQELAGLPLAGLVVVSDGADTSGASLDASLLALKADGIPVFTVGVGRETLERDIQVGRVSTPRSALKGTSLLVDVVVTHTGYAGRTVMLDVEDEGRIVGSQPVRLPADGEPVSVRVRFTAGDAGPRLFRFRVAPQSGEQVTQNNAREALIEVRDRREKILYFEGEPRFEMKFIGRAVSEDKNLQLVTLQRTADNKYLRIGVDNAEELLSGFPKTREELFAYRGLVLGSIEAGAFTGDQLRMIAEFVDRRGGGLLMLGGPRAFAEGGYAGTSVADALPVVLERAATRDPADTPPVTWLQVRPTRAGEGHAVAQIAADQAGSLARWNALPQVTSVNTLRAVKPGATVLLTGVDERRRDQVALAFQRFGRGKALAFPIQDSWTWQMHATIAVDDQTHENFWRQVLRWLIDGVPDAVEAVATERVDPGDPVTLTAEVVDQAFVEINDAKVVATVTRPDGSTVEVPMPWTAEKNGEYRATFPAAEPGRYEARIAASRGEKAIGAALAHVRAAPGDAEYFDPTMRAALLRRIAEETGGRFYTADATATLADDLRYTGRGVTTIEERELWHMPIVLLLLVGLVCAEWGYRRAVGLA